MGQSVVAGRVDPVEAASENGDRWLPARDASAMCHSIDTDGEPAPDHEAGPDQRCREVVRCGPSVCCWCAAADDGYRALAEGKRRLALDAFDKVVSLAPGHPEALAGLTAAEDTGDGGARETGHGFVRLGTHEARVGVPVDHRSMRLEKRATEDALAQRLKLTKVSPRPASFGPRDASTGTLKTEGTEGIDIVVLHDSGTQSAIERFVALTHGDTSAHFLIEWDGSVYQILDLALAAHHTGQLALDARSIAIELVNPLSTDGPPLPNNAKGHERPLSERTRIQ